VTVSGRIFGRVFQISAGHRKRTFYNENPISSFPARPAIFRSKILLNQT
jgi:hypothetical protein